MVFPAVTNYGSIILTSTLRLTVWAALTLFKHQQRKPSYFEILDKVLFFSEYLPNTVSITCALSIRKNYLQKLNTQSVIGLLTLGQSWHQFISLLYGTAAVNILSKYKIMWTLPCDIVDTTYNETFFILISGARLMFLLVKNFRNLWWNEELDALKDAAIQSNNLRNYARKPHRGPWIT